MKRKSIIIIVIISLVLIFHTQIYIGLWFGAAYVEKWVTDYRITKLEQKSREKNREAVEKYIKKEYGDIIYKICEIKYIGRGNGWSVYSQFDLDTPFADGVMWVNSEDQSILGGFNIEGSKFQHNYAEWVKKQVGIDDENVELEFTGTFDEPYIDFDKITTLSEDCREVFENTHNLYAKFCQVKNITSLTEENKIEQAKFAREKYLLPAMNITGITKDKKKYFGGHIDLSNGSFKKNEDLCFTFVFDARISDSELIEKRYWN